MGASTIGKYPFADRTQPMISDHAEALLNRTWRPALSVIGADGFPPIADAGNVLRPRTALRLSLRLPPPVDGAAAAQALKELLEADPPHGASVRFDADEGATGWSAPPTAPWLTRAIDEASRTFYAKPAGGDGRGRHDPVHGDARQALSRCAVPDHRRAGSTLQCARAERIPAHSLRDEADRVRCERHRRARNAET
jgi:hypothetical protein